MSLCEAPNGLQRLLGEPALLRLARLQVNPLCDSPWTFLKQAVVACNLARQYGKKLRLSPRQVKLLQVGALLWHIGVLPGTVPPSSPAFITLGAERARRIAVFESLLSSVPNPPMVEEHFTLLECAPGLRTLFSNTDSGLHRLIAGPFGLIRLAQHCCQHEFSDDSVALAKDIIHHMRLDGSTIVFAPTALALLSKLLDDAPAPPADQVLSRDVCARLANPHVPVLKRLEFVPPLTTGRRQKRMFFVLTETACSGYMYQTPTGDLQDLYSALTCNHVRRVKRLKIKK